MASVRSLYPLYDLGLIGFTCLQLFIILFELIPLACSSLMLLSVGGWAEMLFFIFSYMGFLNSATFSGVRREMLFVDCFSFLSCRLWKKAILRY